MQTDNIRAIITGIKTGGIDTLSEAAQKEMLSGAVDEAFTLLVAVVGSLDRIAGALEMISLNTHPAMISGAS